MGVCFGVFPREPHVFLFFAIQLSTGCSNLRRLRARERCTSTWPAPMRRGTVSECPKGFLSQGTDSVLYIYIYYTIYVYIYIMCMYVSTMTISNEFQVLCIHKHVTFIYCNYSVLYLVFLICLCWRVDKDNDVYSIVWSGSICICIYNLCIRIIQYPSVFSLHVFFSCILRFFSFQISTLSKMIGWPLLLAYIDFNLKRCVEDR